MAVSKYSKTTRQTWKRAWRLARIVRAIEPASDKLYSRVRDLEWKAWCMIGHRDDPFQPNTTPAHDRIEQYRISDEIISKILAERK